MLAQAQNYHRHAKSKLHPQDGILASPVEANDSILWLIRRPTEEIDLNESQGRARYKGLELLQIKGLKSERH